MNLQVVLKMKISSVINPISNPCLECPYRTHKQGLVKIADQEKANKEGNKLMAGLQARDADYW